jgi:hypothetical protein
MTQDRFLYIHFAYLNGDGEDLRRVHLDTFDKCDRFDNSTVSVRTTFGPVAISKNVIGDSIVMPDLDQYRYTNESEEIDIWESPLVEYFIEDSRYLVAENHPSGVSQAQLLEELVEVVKIGYQAADPRPIAVYLETPYHRYKIGQADQPPFTAESIAHDEYDHLSWLTVFTPPMVERYGRDTLLSAPAWKTEEFDDGAILVICHDDVPNWNEGCRDVADHIGLRSFEEL